MQPTVTTLAPPPFPIRPLTLAEYGQLIAQGFFGPEERVELIRGYVHSMTPKGPHHKYGLRRLTQRFYDCVGQEVVIQVQDSILLPATGSQPEPDLALLRPTTDDYVDRHPEPQDVLLVVEVADSTLEFDRDTKAALYAAAALPDYWILNLVDGCLRVHRHPVMLPDGSAQYQTVFDVPSGQTIAPLHLPHCTIDVASVLPSL